MEEHQIDTTLYSIKVLIELRRYDDAVSIIDSFAEMKRNLDNEERNYFLVVYKSDIDSARASFRVIDNFYMSSINEGDMKKAEAISKYRNICAQKIVSLAQKCIDMIDTLLLPATDEIAAQAFYYKMKGDMFRYIAETPQTVEKSQGKEKGKEAYLRALELCNENLSVVDPVRLGTILNAAVFRYEHMDEKTEAFEMLQTAVEETKAHSGEITKENAREVQRAYATMMSNIAVWSKDGEEEEDKNE